MICSIQAVNGYVHLKVSGKVEIEPLLVRLETAIMVCCGRKAPKLLIDLWEVEGVPTETHKAMGGLTMVRLYSKYCPFPPSQFVVAVLGVQSNATTLQLQDAPGIDEMKRAGLQVVHTYNRDEALSYLAKI